jgi:hypothetical protein
MKPELAKEYYHGNPIKAESISLGYRKKVKWVCTNLDCGLIYERTIHNRLRKSDKGCPSCSNAKTYVTNKNNLLVRFPKVVEAFWDYDKNEIDPSNVRPHSNILIWIKCQHGCSVQIPVNALTRKKCKNFKCPCGPNKKNIKPEDD